LTRISILIIFAKKLSDMGTDEKNRHGKTEEDEASIRQHAQQLLQSCEEFLQQCDDMPPVTSDVRPCSLKSIWLRFKDLNY
jgi:hypothetical protein